MIIHGDCIEEMRKLPAESFRTVVTSPPYNLKFKSPSNYKGLWKNSKLLNEGYEGYEDARSDEEYIEWQRECLSEMMRLIDDQGAIFYNHHWKTKDGLLVDRSDIVRGFPVRQILIWDRGSGFNHCPSFFLPNYEVIYLIAKPKFKLKKGKSGWGCVWRILPAQNNDHPAPFPVEIPRRCIEAAGGPVLDPFCGSGTTGVAAKMMGEDFTGIEQSAEYCEMARQRIARPTNLDMF